MLKQKRFSNSKNLIVFKRNAWLFYYRIRFRLLLLGIPILLAYFQGYQHLFNGIPLNIDPKTIPIEWLVQILFPILIVGEVPRKLFRNDIVLSPGTSAGLYLLDNLLITSSFSLLVSMCYFMASLSADINWYFWSYATFYLLLTISIYSLLTIIFKPILIVLSYVVLLVFNTYLGWLTVINLTMLSRFKRVEILPASLELLIFCLVLFIIIQSFFKRIDYSL